MGILSQKSNSTWSGSLRVTAIVITSILAASITIFALAITSAVQVYSAPIDASLYSYPSDYRWSIGWHVAYFTIAPLISTLYSFFDLIIYFFARLSPTYAALGSTVMAIGWVMQLAFWLQCDFIPDYGQCQQFYLVHDDRASMSGAIVGVSTNVTYTKVAFGFVLVTLYVVYLTLAAIALYRRRRARRSHPDRTIGTTDSYLNERRETSESISAAVFYA